MTSVEILRYVEREHPGFFEIGVAYNQYEPEQNEWEKLLRKLDVGAKFVVTQPVVVRDVSVEKLHGIRVPVFIGAWMSRRIEALCECVGVKKPKDVQYDPEANLVRIREGYPGSCVYLAQLGFKRDWSILMTGSSVPPSSPAVALGGQPE